MKARDVVLSWDFWCALIVAISTYYLLPAAPKTDFAKDLYGVGINVLSIVFAVYFAALAIIMASPDDDFILFMEEHGDYSHLVASLRFTQWALFFALLMSLGLYGWTSSRLSAKVEAQHRGWLVLFVFLFFYALFSAAATVHDAIQYSKYRTKFLKINKRS